MVKQPMSDTARWNHLQYIALVMRLLDECARNNELYKFADVMLLETFHKCMDILLVDARLLHKEFVPLANEVAIGEEA